jgi:hypothetical protein
MNTAPSTPPTSDAQQFLFSAIARQIAAMSKEEVQALVTKAQVELEKENAALKERVAKLEAEGTEREKYIKMLCRYIGKLEVDPEDWENFDPSECTIPMEQTLADAEKLLEGYPGDAP